MTKQKVGLLCSVKQRVEMLCSVSNDKADSWDVVV